MREIDWAARKLFSHRIFFDLRGSILMNIVPSGSIAWLSLKVIHFVSFKAYKIINT